MTRGLARTALLLGFFIGLATGFFLSAMQDAYLIRTGRLIQCKVQEIRHR